MDLGVGQASPATCSGQAQGSHRTRGSAFPDTRQTPALKSTRTRVVVATTMVRKRLVCSGGEHITDISVLHRPDRKWWSGGRDVTSWTRVLLLLFDDKSHQFLQLNDGDSSDTCSSHPVGLGQGNGSQRVVPRTAAAAAAAPEKLFKMRILRPRPRPTEMEALGGGQNSVFE